MKRYFGYIRVSTPKQGQGVSLQEQQEAIRRHAERSGVSIVEWFEEKETAAKEGRNVFSRMLSQLEKGRAHGVIMHKVDRSARNLWDWAKLVKLIDRGLDVQFAHDAIDLTSRGGRLSADIMAVIAADYIRNLRDEVKKGFYGRLKQGYYPLPAPLGYVDRGGGVTKEIDPLAGPLVKWAFETYATGTVSLKDLAQDLARRGLQPRRGRKLSVASLAKMLRNPFYIGLIRIDRTSETFQGLHLPLIRKSVFEAVQATMDGRAPRKAITHDFAFRRFALCGHCSRHLVGERKKGRYVYYRCYNPSCRKSVIRERDVMAKLGETAQQVRLSPEEIRDVRDLAERETANERSAALYHDGVIRMRLGSCESKLGKLTDALIEGLIGKDDYESRKRQLLEERRGLLDAIENQPDAATAALRICAYLELPDIVEVRFAAANDDEKRAIGLSMVWNFVAHGKEPAITLKSPYREILNWRKSTTVDRIVSPLELSTKQLYESLKQAAENDNDIQLLQRPQRP